MIRDLDHRVPCCFSGIKITSTCMLIAPDMNIFKDATTKHNSNWHRNQICELAEDAGLSFPIVYAKRVFW